MSRDSTRYAAQYVRMSTDMQKYSIENQSAAIALYAAARGLVIVQSYVDAGRSGLNIKSRDALQTLIDDVVSKRADFGVILVYDVSRWAAFKTLMKAPITNLRAEGPAFLSNIALSL